MIIFIDRVISKILTTYRKALFRKKTGCKTKQLKILGTINIVNRNIKVEGKLTLFGNVSFLGDGNVKIGKNVSIGNNVIIYASKDGGVSIGDNTQIAANCYIIDTDHGIDGGKLIKEQKNNVAPIFIGSDVWIAATCNILKGTIIEDGAVIGAHSLVKGHVEKGSVCCGVPVKEIKKRILNE